MLRSQNDELATLLALFDKEFFATGTVSFDAENGEVIVRACAALRLRLRCTLLKTVADEALESGEIAVDSCAAPCLRPKACVRPGAPRRVVVVEPGVASVQCGV